MELIDNEVKRILLDASQRSTELLGEHREKLDALARALLEKEELSEGEIKELIGPSIHEQLEANGKPSHAASSMAPEASRNELPPDDPGNTIPDDVSDSESKTD